MRRVPNELRESVRDTVVRRLGEHQQRMTAVREQLVEILAAADRPLTIPEVLDAGQGLAQSSVYRNLVVLEQVGVVHRVVTHDEFARYELAEDLTEHHHHLVCSNCGRVEDLPASESIERSVEAAVVQAARKVGFQTRQHRLDLVGTCADCS
jgi:Fur family transcriptional regulator, ferric uptake regulator